MCGTKNDGGRQSAQSFISEALGRIKKEEIELREIWENSQLAEPFHAVQRARLTYRDAECEFDGLSATSSPWHGIHIEECKFRMTEQRVAYLNNIYASDRL